MSITLQYTCIHVYLGHLSFGNYSGMRILGMAFEAFLLLPVLIRESLEWYFMPFHVFCYLGQNEQNEQNKKKLAITWQSQNGSPKQQCIYCKFNFS